MSKVDELKQDIVKTREDLKAIFESADENGKYSADQKESIAKANTLLAEQVDDLKLEEAKVKNEKALEVENEPVNSIPNPMPEQKGPQTIGEQFANTDAYKAYVEKGVKGVVKGVTGAVKDNPVLALAALNFAPMLVGGKPFIGMGGGQFNLPGLSGIKEFFTGGSKAMNALKVGGAGAVITGLLAEREQQEGESDVDYAARRAQVTCSPEDNKTSNSLLSKFSSIFLANFINSLVFPDIAETITMI